MKRQFILLLFVSSIVYAQEKYSDPYMFFPATVGDHWEYSSTGLDYDLTIVRDSLALVDSSKYIYYSHLNYPEKPAYRIDKDYNVFVSPHSSNFYRYKLDAEVGDSWIVWGEDTETQMEATIRSIYEGYVLGKLTQIKEISFHEYFVYSQSPNDTISIYFEIYYLAYGFGLIMIQDYVAGPTILNGCRINGITYGVVDVFEYIEKTTDNYLLYQNYPNPFNPTTMIFFSIPEHTNAVIKLYDTLGREVKELACGYFLPGIHQVQFHASNLASGVYLYTIRAGSFYQARKMLLLK